MYSAEGIGKTIEKAIENALFELKATKEDVDIKILNEGGLFKKAKVLVSISEDALPKYEKKSKVNKVEKEETKTEEPHVEETKIEENNVVESKVEENNVTSQHGDDEDIEEDDLQDNSKVNKTIDPVEFLKNFFEKAGKDVEIEVKEDENYRTYAVVGENLGDMIGHRGECFYAISRLLSVVAGRQDKKILLDIGDYREKRKESLTQLALRSASKVAKSGRYIRLDPMNPSDRRIIHTALQDDSRVTTLSKGTDPHRYVIIFPKEYDEK